MNFKKYKDFIKENVRIVKFHKSKKSNVKDDTSTKNTAESINAVIVDLNKLLSKYGASIDKTSIKGHLTKRIKERNFDIQEIPQLFKDIEKNSKYFDDLKKNSELLIDGKGPQLINTTKKLHVGTIVKNNGTIIVVKSIMGNFSRKYMQDLRTAKIPLYFTR